MAGTATFQQTNMTTQDPVTWAAAQDGNTAVAASQVDCFACHAAATPNMTVLVDAGNVPVVGGNPVAVAQQTSALLTAPTTNPRNDIVYVDPNSGAMGIVTGTEAASPSDPTTPAGMVAVARIRHAVGETYIANSQIDDLRSAGFLSAGNKRLAFTSVVNVTGNYTIAENGVLASVESGTNPVVTVSNLGAGAVFSIGAAVACTVATPNGLFLPNGTALGTSAALAAGAWLIAQQTGTGGAFAIIACDPVTGGTQPTAISAIAPTLVTASGTVTIPTGAKSAEVIVTGPGGGGGNSASAESAGGGGAGGTAIKHLTGLTAGNTLTATVTAGGTPSANSSATALASGTQTITTISGGAGAAGSPGSDGSPGVGSGGDANFYGGYGGTGRYNEGSYVDGGDGGASYWGGGGNGGNNASNGSTGLAWGSGGGGAGAGASTHAGGNGAQGVIFIKWYPF